MKFLRALLRPSWALSLFSTCLFCSTAFGADGATAEPAVIVSPAATAVAKPGDSKPSTKPAEAAAAEKAPTSSAELDRASEDSNPSE